MIVVDQEGIFSGRVNDKNRIDLRGVNDNLLGVGNWSKGFV